MRSLPKPYVELAIQIAKGSADFLKKDLVAAIGNLKDEQLRVAFHEANRKAQMRSTIMPRGWSGRNFRKPPWISRWAKKNSGASWRRRNSLIFLRKKSSRSAWSN